MATYGGHKNWNYWNVSLWIGNDEGLYNEAVHLCKMYPKARDSAARHMLGWLKDQGITETPDGAPYTVSSIRAAMRGM